MQLAQKLKSTIDFKPSDKFEDNLSETASLSNDSAAKLLNSSNSINFGCVENFSNRTIKSRTIPSASVYDEAVSNIFIKDISNRSSRKKEKELQWWLGKVVELKDNTFTGKLEDLEGRINIVEFDTLTVPENKRENIKVDSQFTYCIMAKESFTGSLEYSSKINFLVKKSWKSEYEEHVQKIMDKFFPGDFF